MNEDFLHYVWKFQLFNPHGLLTTEGEKVEVFKAGLPNQNAGPDFFNGQLKVGDTLWAGNVEIHLKSSDWFQHQHQTDKLYDKIILHVVWENDREVRRESGELIPTIELSGRVSKVLLERYKFLKKNENWVPCESELASVDQFVKLQQLDRMLVERLENKSRRIEQLLELNTNDWEAVFYQMMCRYMGLKVNGTPFELLATALPYSILRKHQSDLLQLEALLLKQAGLLEEDFKGDYPMRLQKEYRFLKNKYQLASIETSLWKFMRMRPSNFPTIRLAQLAALIHKNKKFFEQLRETKSIDQFYQLFDVAASPYWDAHYRFDVPASRKRKKKMGQLTKDVLMINVAVPLLFVYAEKRDDELGKQLAFQMLEEIPAEKNAIAKKWKALGMLLESAFHSQALLQLKKEYCDHKRCLSCKIGNSILRKQ